MRGSGLLRFARNDVGDTRVRILATEFARALLASSPQEKSRGRREGRVAACTRGPRAEKIARAREPQVQAVTTGLPCAMVYDLYALSSVNHPVCHRRRRDALSIVGNLAPDLWGARTTRLRRPRIVPLVNRHIPVHRIPPHVRDDRDTPLCSVRNEVLIRQIRISENRNIFARGA